MKKQYKLAVFDLDGTVLDTLSDLADSMNAVLLEGGYPTHTREAICSFVGNGIRNLVERALPQSTPEGEVLAVYESFKSYYGAHCAEKTAPYEGVLPMLSRLRREGIRTAVLSNKADFATKALCQRYFGGLFDLVAGEREAEGVRKKPAPDALFSMMRQLAVMPAETVYIGDSDVDVLTAQNAGVDALFVSWGFRDATFLQAHGAIRIFDTAEALAAAILGED